LFTYLCIVVKDLSAEINNFNAESCGAYLALCKPHSNPNPFFPLATLAGTDEILGRSANVLQAVFYSIDVFRVFDYFALEGR
jgi:hypothetical protein